MPYTPPWYTDPRLLNARVVRTASPDTIQRDISAWELAKIMGLQQDYTQRALDAMTPQDRALVERHSTPVPGEAA